MLPMETIQQIFRQVESQYKTLKTAFDAIKKDTPYHQIIAASQDIDAQVALLKSFRNADNSWSIDNTLRAYSVGILSVLRNFEDYLGSVGEAGGLDGWLSRNDVRVSSTLAGVYRLAKGMSLLATNVYLDREIAFGSAVADEDGGWDFSDGENLGMTGNQLLRCDGVNFTPAPVKIKVVKCSKPINATMFLQQYNDDIVELVAEISEDDSGKEILCGGGRFMDLRNLEVDGGAPGDAISVCSVVTPR